MAQRGRPLSNINFRQHSAAGPVDTSTAELIEGLGNQGMSLLSGGVQHHTAQALRNVVSDQFREPLQEIDVSHIGEQLPQDEPDLLSRAEGLDSGAHFIPSRAVELLSMDMEQLRAAHMQGAMSDEEMNVRLRSAVKGYIDRFPGLSPEIRQVYNDFVNFDEGYMVAMQIAAQRQAAAQAVVDEREAVIRESEDLGIVGARMMANSSDPQERAYLIAMYGEAQAAQNMVNQLKRQNELFNLMAQQTGGPTTEELGSIKRQGLARAVVSEYIARNPLPMLGRGQGETYQDFANRIINMGPSAHRAMEEDVERWYRQAEVSLTNHPDVALAFRDERARELAFSELQMIRDNALGLIRQGDPTKLAADAQALVTFTTSTRQMQLFQSDNTLLNLTASTQLLSVMAQIAAVSPSQASELIQAVTGRNIVGSLGRLLTFNPGEAQNLRLTEEARRQMDRDGAVDAAQRRQIFEDSITTIIDSTIGNRDFFTDPRINDDTRIRTVRSLLNSFGDRSEFSQLTSSQEANVYRALASPEFTGWVNNLSGPEGREFKDSFLTQDFGHVIGENVRERVRAVEDSMAEMGLSSAVGDLFFDVFDRKWNEDIGSYVFTANLESALSEENIDRLYTRVAVQGGPRFGYGAAVYRDLISRSKEEVVIDSIENLVNDLNRKVGVELGQALKAAQNLKAIAGIERSIEELYNQFVVTRFGYDPFNRREAEDNEDGN